MPCEARCLSDVPAFVTKTIRFGLAVLVYLLAVILFGDLNVQRIKFFTTGIVGSHVKIFCAGDYYDNPEANAKAFRNGWFRTGDLGHLDQQGFLYITGRASDMYISGGSNVYPREIEEKVLAHPAVAEVAIVGVPDLLWGEIGVAVCVLQPNARLNEHELLAWLAPKVARYKLPRRVFFWNELPRSGYGKITKKIIRAELDARGCLSPDQKTAIQT